MKFWPKASPTSLKPLKYACTVNPEALPESTDPDYEFDYIDIGNVTLEQGISGLQRMTFANSPSRARKPLLGGDIIVSTVRTYLKAVAAVPAEAQDWVASTGFAVLRPNHDVDQRFLYRVVQSNPFVETVVAASTGVSYPAINPSTLGTISVPLPDRETQRAIADFLDRETARIDQLVEKRSAFAELVVARRQSLVSTAVLGHAGVHSEWPGQIPQHWKAERAKFHFREAQARSETGEEELLTVSHITGVTKRSDKDVNMFLAESNEGYKLVEPGDLVINTMWAWMGAMGVSSDAGLISPSYGVYRPSSNELLPQFIDLMVRSRPFIAEATRRSKGIHSSRLRLYPDAFLDMPLPTPPCQSRKKYSATYQSALRKRMPSFRKTAMRKSFCANTAPP